MDSVMIIVVAAILTLVLTFFILLLQLLGWLKIEPTDVKRFLVIRGRALAWNAYLLIATAFTIYFLVVLSIVFSNLPFSIGLATLIILILWALLGLWVPAVQRLRNKRVNTAVNIVAICLLTLMLVGFWITKWPEIQQSIVVTLLLLALVALYIIDRIIKKRKARKSK